VDVIYSLYTKNMPKETKKSATKKVAPKKVAANKNEVSLLLQQNIVHALAYFPYLIGAVSMYFLGRTNKKAAMHHIVYSWIIWVAAIVGHIFLTGSILGWMIFPAYMIGSWFLAWKAYNGQDVQIEILDSVEEKISETIKK